MSRSAGQNTEPGWGQTHQIREFDQYVVKVDGTGRLTTWNRQFLKSFTPYGQSNVSPKDDDDRGHVQPEDDYDHGPNLSDNDDPPGPGKDLDGNTFARKSNRIPRKPERLKVDRSSKTYGCQSVSVSSIHHRLVGAGGHQGDWVSCAQYSTSDAGARQGLGCAPDHTIMGLPSSS